MIERNLGNIERVVRLLLGLALAAWLFSRPALNGIEWFVMVIALFLILNGIFQRCYLWYILDIDTLNGEKRTPTGDPDCGRRT